MRNTTRFADVWIQGKIPPVPGTVLDKWEKRVLERHRHEVMRDGLGLPHLRLDVDTSEYEPTAQIPDGFVTGKVSFYARVECANDYYAFADDVEHDFDEIGIYDRNVDFDIDSYLDE